MSRMKVLVLSAVLLFGSSLVAQTAELHTAAEVQGDLRDALVGEWAGTLEYRDYSEPPGSTKREQLPTWLTVAVSGAGLTWHYIYDDGPTKIIDETDVVTFDVKAATYAEGDNGKSPQVFKVAGYEGLKNGRGTLVLTGSGTDNDKPSETKITLTIRRNLLEVLEETRPAGSTEAFVYRHAFRFTRSKAPALTVVSH